MQDSFGAMKHKKVDHVDECFEEVSKSFGKIFSQLLPGAECKLEKIDCMGRGKNSNTFKCHGSEIKVGFNGVWKESLSELSGGQRSLLALSFLIAMLKYKSAPFYILDEIDAALDLSHTENVGQIIAENFPNSQFIIISLKEGLYENANVLYVTNLVDGHSRVTRREQKFKPSAVEENKAKSYTQKFSI